MLLKYLIKRHFKKQEIVSFENLTLNLNTMKRFMSALLIAILFTSCSSDDDSSSKKTIVGAWTLTEANVDNPMDYNNDGTADRNFLDEVSCFEGSLSFTESGTFSQTFTTGGAVTENGVTTFQCTGTVTNTGTYQLDGDQLTTTIDGPEPTTSVTTIVLDNNTLKGTFDGGILGDVELVYNRN